MYHHPPINDAVLPTTSDTSTATINRDVTVRGLVVSLVKIVTTECCGLVSESDGGSGGGSSSDDGDGFATTEMSVEGTCKKGRGEGLTGTGGWRER